MRVAVLTTVFPRWEGDFFGSYIFQHAEAHVASGADVRVIAPHAPNTSTQEEIRGVRVERFRYGVPASAETIAYGGGVLTQLDRGLLAKLLLPVFVLSFLLRSVGVVRWAEVVHAHWTLAGIIGLSLARLFRRRSVLTVYGIEVFTGRFSFFTKLCLRWADHVICISTATEKKMRERFGEDVPEVSSVIPFGVPAEFLDADSGSFDIREHHGLPASSIIVLTVGRLIERKGLEYLIRAASAPVSANACALIVGQGPERARLEELAAEIGAGPRVTFAGAVTDERLPAYYAQCDVFAHPVITDRSGDMEGLGIVLLEAMAAAKPVVASGIGGITDVVVDGETGYLVAEKDVSALAEHIARLVDDPGLRERMGAAGKRHVRDHFYQPNLAADVMQVYERLAAP